MALVKQVATKIICQIKKGNYSRFQLHYVCGPMGSGKSSYTDNVLLKKYDIKAYHCNIDKYICYFDDADSYTLYTLCRKVGIIVTDYLLDNRISMIIEGIGVNKDTVEFLKKARQSDYTVNTYFMMIDMETCRERVKNRNNKGRHKVTDENVIKAYNILYGDDSEMKEMIEPESDNVYAMNSANNDFVKPIDSLL